MRDEQEEILTMQMDSPEDVLGEADTLKDQLKRMGTQNVLASLKNIDPSFVINESVDFGSDPNRMPDIQMRGR